MAFCVYIAARVFVQYLKSRSDDSAARSSLQFLFSALGALKQKNPLTESFLVQLDVDIEGTAIDDIRPRPMKKIRRAPSRTVSTASSLAQQTRPPTVHPTNDDLKIQYSDEETAPDTQPLTSICPNSRPTPATEEGDSPSSSNNSRQTSARAPATLPSRRKQRPVPANPASVACPRPNDLYAPPRRNGTGPTGGRGAVPTLDMDLSPEFTDGSTNSTTTTTHNNSNNAVPEDPGVTLNRPPSNSHPQLSSMLNGSTQPHSQPPQQHQHPRLHPSGTTHPLEPNTSMAPSSLEDMVPGPYMDITYPGRGYPPMGIVTPLDSTGSEGSIPMPSTWDFAPAQDPSADAVHMTTGGMDSFSEAQWAQLLASGNWNAWRNHG